jgi:hypothetical protein
MENYKIIHNINDNYHINFNKTCENISINNFRENQLMMNIVQNCSFLSGTEQYNFICNNYSDILNKLDYNLLKRFDSIGGNKCQLINGLTPKVYSYIREAIIFYKFYLEPRNITEIDNLLIIGGGYGLEFCVLYIVCTSMGIKINHISGIDMNNIAKLQNTYFELVEMDNIFKSYSFEEYKLNPDYVYSNCCLAELTCKINYEYYINYCLPSKGFYIVWGQWAAEIPEYYKPFIVKGKHHELINDGLINKNTNSIIVK